MRYTWRVIISLETMFSCLPFLVRGFIVPTAVLGLLVSIAFADARTGSSLCVLYLLSNSDSDQICIGFSAFG